MTRKLSRPLEEMLCLARLGQFQGLTIAVPPRGREAALWRPWYARSVYRNGYQERQHARASRAWHQIALRRQAAR